MNELRIRVSNSVRIALALVIAVANAALFAASSSAAVPMCGEACVKKSGGALGFYVICEGEGNIVACQEGLTECYGYECPTAEPRASVVFEPIPVEFTAPGN